jgi:hypothetical protein
MKISVEAKVAAAVATAFVALMIATIAQGNGASQTGGPYGYGPTNNSGVEAQVSQQEYDSSAAKGNWEM